MEEEVHLDPYTEVARRFFNEFLELKARLDSGVITASQMEKELKKWKAGNAELKATCGQLAERIAELESYVADLEANNAELTRRLTEAEIRGRMADKVVEHTKKYPFVEHMSEESKREWMKLMSAIPNDYRHR